MPTVTANLRDLFNNNDVGWAIFTLVGAGMDVPRISGALLSTLTVKAQANGTGAISQNIVGNDVITPSGTSYVVEVFSDEGSYISTARYNITGSDPIDLSTLTPLV